MKSETKFQKGDLVTVLDCPGLLGSQVRHIGKTYEVTRAEDVNGRDVYSLGAGNILPGFFEDELEFAAIHNSPLMKALS